jgi:ABC-type phosphate transport system substrate-binding protein
MAFLELSRRVDLDENRVGTAVRCGVSMGLRRWWTVTLLVLSAAGAASAKDLALISNKGNAVTTIAMADLVKICKGQTSRWPDGKPLTFITRDPSSPEMKLAVEKIYNMPPEAINELIATANHGRMNHPAIVVVNSDEDLVKRVASTPGAVGLVDVYSINSAVEVVKIGGKLPLGPGYPLHGNY